MQERVLQNKCQAVVIPSLQIFGTSGPLILWQWKAKCFPTCPKPLDWLGGEWHPSHRCLAYSTLPFFPTIQETACPRRAVLGQTVLEGFNLQIDLDPRETLVGGWADVTGGLPRWEVGMGGGPERWGKSGLSQPPLFMMAPTRAALLPAAFLLLLILATTARAQPR